MDIESKINELLFFSLVKDGLFDFNILIKSNLLKFNEDKTTELSPSSLEYLCYKMIKNKINQNIFINMDIGLINYNYLTSNDIKSLSNKLKKKHIIIIFQNENTQKWNLIIFLDFYEQIKNHFNTNNNENNIIIGKIISSNCNNEEDNYIILSILNKLENVFNFSVKNNLMLKIDSININKRINTSIFILNFIEELISQKNENINLYIQKLFDEMFNSNNKNKKSYFSSFNKINKIFDNIFDEYEKDLKENNINKSNKNNTNNEKNFNGKIKMIRNEMNSLNEMIKYNKFLKKDMYNDSTEDINSEDENEVIKIIQNEHNKNIRNKQKLNHKLNTKSINLENNNIYKEFGVIKEEENESSSSESYLKPIKSKSKENNKIFRAITSYRKKDSNKINKKFKHLKVDINASLFDKINRSPCKKYKSQKKIKVKKDILKNLEEAIEEFEFEQQQSMKIIDLNKNNKSKKEIKINKNNIYEEDSLKNAINKNKNPKKIKIKISPNPKDIFNIISKENKDVINNNKEKGNNNLNQKIKQKQIFINRIIKVPKTQNKKIKKINVIKKKSLTSRVFDNSNKKIDSNDNIKQHNKKYSFQNIKNKPSFLKYNTSINKENKKIYFNDNNISIDNFININSVYNLFIKNGKTNIPLKDQISKSKINIQKRNKITSIINMSQKADIFNIEDQIYNNIEINNKKNYPKKEFDEVFENIDEKMNNKLSETNDSYIYEHLPNIPSMDINNKNMQYFINNIENNNNVRKNSEKSKHNKRNTPKIDKKIINLKENKTSNNFKINPNLKKDLLDEYNTTAIKRSQIKKIENARYTKVNSNIDEGRGVNVYNYAGGDS